MKAILIDDEFHALLQLKWLLEKEPDIEVIGAYENAEEGLLHLSREQVDLVFLDIEMPVMDGLETAASIPSLNEDAHVVFVTAYSSYALEAFNVNALDYLLKPIDPVRFSGTLERIRKSAARSARAPKIARPAARPEIEMLGQLRINPASSQRTVKWRTLKAKELFAYLLQHRGLWLTRDVLLDEVWPAFDLNKALVHLHTAVYQVRRMLKETGLGAALDFSLESYRLDGDGLATDADQIQQAADAAAAGQLALSEAAAAWEQYRGHYLDKEDYPWVKSRRETLLQAYIALTLHVTASERAVGALESALRRARRACELHPYSERLTRELLACLAAIGDTEELRSSYAIFCKLAAEEWGTEPSAEFLAYGQQLMRQMT